MSTKSFPLVDRTVFPLVPVDVNPLTFGIETTSGVFTKLIPRNTSFYLQGARTAEDGARMQLLTPLFS